MLPQSPAFELGQVMAAEKVDPLMVARLLGVSVGVASTAPIAMAVVLQL
jgi:hypothetical protein